MTTNDEQNCDDVLEQDFLTTFKEQYPDMMQQLTEFRDNLSRYSNHFTKPITILSVGNVDCIFSSFILIKTLSSLNCPFEVHFFSNDNDMEEMSRYMTKRGHPEQETNPIILLGYPFHLSSFREAITPWMTTLKTKLHAIDIELPASLPIQKLGVNARLPWTVTSLTAILSILMLEQITWWHFLAVLLVAYHEHLDVGISSNHVGITDLFVKEATNRGLLNIKPDINIPITSSTNMIESLELILSPAFSTKDNIEKFLLKHEVEARDKRTTSLRTLQDLTASEKKRLISGLIQELGLTPESLIRKTLELKIDNNTSLNLKTLNSILIEMLTDIHVTPGEIIKMSLALPLDDNLDSYRRKNGFNLETTLYEAIRALKETKFHELNSKNVLWFKIDREFPLEIKAETVGFVCRQLRKNIIVSSPIAMESTPQAWNHLFYFYLDERKSLSIKTLETVLEEFSRMFLGFQLQRRVRHRCINFQTSTELTIEQLNLVIQSMEEGAEPIDAM